jgi:hypothetical protein
MPEKWTPLFRQEYAQAFEPARFLFGQAISPGRKTRQARLRTIEGRAMDAAGIAMAAVASSRAKVQMALAAKLAKMNVGAEQSVVALIEAASANMQTILKSTLAPGVGGSLDISV